MGESLTLTEPELDDPAPADLLEKGPTPKEEEAAHTVLANGKRLIEEAEGKSLDKSARARDLSRYLETLDTVNKLDQKSDTVTAILADITAAIHARQDATGALLWALNKSGLVRDVV